MARSLFTSKNVRVEVDDQGLQEFLKQNKDIRDLLFSTANKVKSKAESSAQDAQGGPGGQLHDYAEAGFSVVWEPRGKRPRVNVVSNADPLMAVKVHIYTTIRDGIGHLRKALKDGA